MPGNPSRRERGPGQSLSLRGLQPAHTLAWPSAPPPRPSAWPPHHASLASLRPLPCPLRPQGDGRSSVSFLHPQSHILDQAPALTCCLNSSPTGPPARPASPAASPSQSNTWPVRLLPHSSSQPAAHPVGSTFTRTQSPGLPPTAAPQPLTVTSHPPLQRPQRFLMLSLLPPPTTAVPESSPL